MVGIQTFISGLLDVAPRLRDVQREHIDEYDELLPHVFMADVTRYVIGLVEEIERGEKFSIAELSSIVKYLEDSLSSGDEEVKNLIEASFIENLERDQQYYPLLKKYFGPKLLNSLRAYVEFYYS